MKIKKLFSAMLSFIVLLGAFSIVPTGAFAKESGDFEYNIVDNKAEISSYKGTSDNLTIPDAVDGYIVTGIGENAFKKSNLKSVTVPDSVKYISQSAFAYCKNLERVVLSNTLESIGDTAFYDCDKLSSKIEFPNTLKVIGDCAFENCWSMTYAVIPKNVEKIGYCSFGYYYELEQTENKYYDYKRLDFRILGYENSSAYEYCDKHKLDFYSLDTGVSAETLNGMDFFINSSREAELISYADDDDAVSIPSKVNGCPVKYIGRLAFFATNIKRVVIPNTVVEIGEWAFESCDNLAVVSVPPTVKTIGRGALGYYYDDGVDYSYLNFKICGAVGSSAETYAKDNGFAFEDTYTTVITLTKNSEKIYVGGKVQIKANIKNGFGKTTYTSSSKKIATVNSSGKVTAVKAGKTKITVQNNGVKKTFTVTVKNPKLNKTSVKIKRGKTFKLKITGKVGKAKFSSSNKKIVRVNNDGKLKGVAVGKANITVKTNGMKLKCKVVVKKLK